MSLVGAVVFDIGNVILEVSFAGVWEKWAEILYRSPRQIQSAFRFDEQYARFERGEIEPCEFRDYVRGLLGCEMTDEEFDLGWNNLGYLPIQDTVCLLEKTAMGGVRVVALTNTNATHADFWRGKHQGILSNFEKVFCSQEIGHRKPEQAAYQTVLDYLGIPASSVVFVDDSPANVEAAGEMGMRAVLASDPQAVETGLGSLGVLGTSTDELR